MSILNHDTELEEILKTIFATHEMSGAWLDTIKDIVKVMNTYFYKQTLELIGDEYDADTPELDEVDEFKAQLRKAAAERWGQE